MRGAGSINRHDGRPNAVAPHPLVHTGRHDHRLPTEAVMPGARCLQGCLPRQSVEPVQSLDRTRHDVHQWRERQVRLPGTVEGPEFAAEVRVKDHFRPSVAGCRHRIARRLQASGRQCRRDAGDQEVPGTVHDRRPVDFIWTQQRTGRVGPVVDHRRRARRRAFLKEIGATPRIRTVIPDHM